MPRRATNPVPHFGSNLCSNLSGAAKILLPEAAAAGPARTCHHRDTRPQFPPSSPPPSGNHSHLNPFPSPGVPFPERGFEQRRDVRPLDVQIRRSAFRHLLPLAVAEAAATDGGTPQSIVGMASRGPSQSAGRNQKRRKVGGVRLRRSVGPGRSECAAVVCCPPSAPARPAARLGLLRPATAWF